jgi:hypothetical protein
MYNKLTTIAEIQQEDLEKDYRKSITFEWEKTIPSNCK